jgi:hypothetical protein
MYTYLVAGNRLSVGRATAKETANAFGLATTNGTQYGGDGGMSMRRTTTLLLAIIALLAQAASAAIEFEFHQTRRSEVRSVPPFDVSGRAVIDGPKSRIDFLTGNGYPPGSYVISTDGSRNLIFVDPARKTFAEMNLGAALAGIGTANLSVENLKSKFDELPDHAVVAGLPTNHRRLTLTYEVTMRFATIALKQAVTTVIDKWTTSAFGDVNETFLSSGGFHTGNAQVDEMINMETTRFKGLTLRQTVQITTINEGPRLQSSELKIDNSRKQVTETTITSVRSREVGAELFQVPAAYRREDNSRKDQETPVHILSMEPPSK